ncbi:MAG: hypothetical protein U0931_08665 [Vulcanimicrobiota bacterium]
MGLAELMVSMGLLSVVSLVTLQLYLSAQTEFQLASGNITLSQRVRATSDRIAQYLKTACPPNPQLSSNPPFYHPNFSSEPARELYEADFISSVCFLRNPAKPAAWPVTDATAQDAFVGTTDPRYIYENDVSFTAPILRYPSLYRYRIAWNPLVNDSYTRKGRTGPRSIPPRAVYIERLTYAESGNPNEITTSQSLTYPGSGVSGVGPYSLAPFLPDTGTPYSNMSRTILAPVVHLLSFNAYSSNVILMRVRIYNRDPENPSRLTDGVTMNRSGFGGNRDRNAPNGVRNQFVEMTTNVHIPNVTMK